MRLERKVVVGHWQDEDVQASFGCLTRGVCLARCTRRPLRSFWRQHREVAVTEGDKVNAQMRLGYSVNGYGVGDLVRFIDATVNTQKWTR